MGGKGSCERRVSICPEKRLSMNELDKSYSIIYGLRSAKLSYSVTVNFWLKAKDLENLSCPAPVRVDVSREWHQTVNCNHFIVKFLEESTV